MVVGWLELPTYGVMCAVAYFAFAVKNRGVVYSWIALYVAYSIIVRFGPPTGDIAGYADAVSVWPPPISLYTLREPVFWLGLSGVYQFLRSTVLLFVVVDLAVCVLVLRSMWKLDDGSNGVFFLGPAILSSYVFLLGQQNTLRQHIALVILLLAVVARQRNQRAAYIWFLLSVLTHNSTALFLGYWFDSRKYARRLYGPLITLSGVIAVAVLLPWLKKSGADTGVDTRYIYVVLTATLVTLLLFARSGIFQARVSLAIVNFVAFLPALVVLRSAQFERIAMMFLVFILIELCRHHKRLGIDRYVVSNLAFGILVIPVFLFPSALGMLVT